MPWQVQDDQRKRIVLQPDEAVVAKLPWSPPDWLQMLVPWAGAVVGLCSLGVKDVGLIEVGLFLGMVMVSGLGVTIGYHRFFAHQAFQAKPWLQVVLGVCGATAVQGRILFWASTHRTHHQHTDGAGDPHSPHHPAGGWRGLWRAHAGWLLANHPQIYVRQARDLLAQPLVAWLDRYYLVWVLLGLLAPGLLGAACHGSWTGFLGGVLWGGFIRIVVQHNGTFLVNSLSHAAGSRTFRTPDESRNNWLVAWVTLGEWHNNHHAFPSSARQGLFWWEVDSSYWVIRALAAAGWAWGVREPSDAALCAKRIRKLPSRSIGPDQRTSVSITSAPAIDRAVGESQAFLQDLFRGYQPRDFAVRFWDGSPWDADPGQPARCTLVLRHPASLRRMFWPPNRLPLAEAYLYDDYEVEGDMEAFAGLIMHLQEQRAAWSLGDRLRWGLRLFRLPSAGPPRAVRAPVRLRGSRHSVERDRQAVTFHYDVSNEFYSLWLDSRMVYSCAYFHAPDENIDTAQERKLDYVCRKLGLQPGERLLDIGCGWGGLAIHAAQHYRARVLGITLSRPQVELGNQRIRQAGLADRCRLEDRDYRALHEPNGFDKVAAIGMVEHVGEARLAAYFQQAWDLLKPGGLFLSQGIALPGTDRLPRWANFANRYVFPDGELVPISIQLRAAEKVGFEVRDLESLREHYLLTLRHWLRRLEERAPEARQLTDDFTYRVYRFYLAAAAFLFFQAGKLNVYQALLAKPHRGDSRLPLTRRDWYR